MDNNAPFAESARAIINGRHIRGIAGVTLDPRMLDIHLQDREYIKVFAFSSLMLPGPSKRIGADEYVLAGPRIGLYHDTEDVREGPSINHFINQLTLSVTYYSDDELWFNLKGRADLSKSSFDPYWYHGATSGDWHFEVAFIHRIKRA